MSAWLRGHCLPGGRVVHAMLLPRLLLAAVAGCGGTAGQIGPAIQKRGQCGPRHAKHACGGSYGEAVGVDHFGPHKRTRMGGIEHTHFCRSGQW